MMLGGFGQNSVMLYENEATVYLLKSNPTGKTNLSFPKEILSEDQAIIYNKIDE